MPKKRSFNARSKFLAGLLLATFCAATVPVYVLAQAEQPAETTRYAKPTVSDTLDILRSILTQPAPQEDSSAEEASTTEGSSQSGETNSQTTTIETPETVVELKEENEELRRQLEILRDYERRETVRRIEDLKMRRDRLTNDIDAMQREHEAMSAHIDYLEKTITPDVSSETEETQSTTESSN